MGTEPGRVLVVDDDPFIGRLVEQLLVAAGFAVERHEDPAAAIARLDQPWDVVLTDLSMPGLDGVAVIAAARESGAARVVLMSGDADALREVAHRADAALSKPFQRSALLEAVKGAPKRSSRRRSPPR